MPINRTVTLPVEKVTVRQVMELHEEVAVLENDDRKISIFRSLTSCNFWARDEKSGCYVRLQFAPLAQALAGVLEDIDDAQQDGGGDE